jgi:hypothetical protein
MVKGKVNKRQPIAERRSSRWKERNHHSSMGKGAIKRGERNIKKTKERKKIKIK